MGMFILLGIGNMSLGCVEKRVYKGKLVDYGDMVDKDAKRCACNGLPSS